MDLITKIKDMAHKIAEGYLIFGKPIDEQVYGAHESGDIDNKEVLKRVCELVNQNVYLSLFHNGTTDNSNINFNYANYESIIRDINNTEADMDAYSMPLDDFRSGLHVDNDSDAQTPESDDSYEKIASAYDAVALRDQFDNFIGTLNTVKMDSVKVAEQSYIQMKSDARIMSYNGDTIDDMSKLASTFANDEGFDMSKIASTYDIIKTELVESGAIVREGITKVAEQPINFEDEFYQPIEKFATAIEAIAATDEMIASMSSMRDSLNEALHA